MIIFLTTSCFSVQSIQEYKNGVAIQYVGKDTKHELDKIINIKCKEKDPYTWDEYKIQYETAYNINGVIQNNNAKNNIQAVLSTTKEERRYSLRTAMCHSPKSILSLSEKKYLDNQSKICSDEINTNTESKYKACQECIALLNNAYNNRYYDMDTKEKNIFFKSHTISCELNPFKCTDSRVLMKNLSKSPSSFLETEDADPNLQKVMKSINASNEIPKLIGTTAISIAMLLIVIL